MRITAYKFQVSPRQYLNWDDPQIERFALNIDDKFINFDPNDYIDATLVVNDKQIGKDVDDNNFKEIGGFMTVEQFKNGNDIIWFWRVINLRRNRRGQWAFTLQADIFKNWDLSAHPIRASKLNILNDETFRLIQQSFEKYPVVRSNREVVSSVSALGMAIVYATQPLATSGSNIDNQFTLNSTPPVLSGLPVTGTRYKTKIEINNLYAHAGFSVWRNATGTPMAGHGRAFRIYSNGDTSQLTNSTYGATNDTDGHFSTLNQMLKTNDAINNIAPATMTLTGSGGIPAVVSNPPPGVGNIVSAIRNLTQVNGIPDTVPSVVTQFAGRQFVQGGKVWRMIVTTTVENKTGTVTGNSQADWYYYLMTGDFATQMTTQNSPWGAFYDINETYQTVTYEDLGPVQGLYDINWSEGVSIPPMAGSSVYAYAFNVSNREVGEALVTYFYKTYGSLIQDAQFFENLTQSDLNTSTVIATVSIGTATQFSVLNITSPTTSKTMTSTLLTSYLALSRKERLYTTAFLSAPDGSSMLAVDKTFVSPIVRVEFDMLPLEGKIYARFNYIDNYTGIYTSVLDTPKMIQWRALKFSGALLAFVEYTLQNSTFQQIANANFSYSENNNRILDAQQQANFDAQIAQQDIGIEQQKANANIAIAGTLIAGGAGLATGNPLALIGMAGGGLSALKQQMGIGFQQQSNAVTNQQTAYNNGVASMLRANELALSKQTHDLNIQALRDRPNTVIPSNGVSIKRANGVQVYTFRMPLHIRNVLEDITDRFGYDLDIVWTWAKNQNVMGHFMYLPYTPRINEFLQSMLSAGLYRENYLSFGSNIVVQ